MKIQNSCYFLYLAISVKTTLDLKQHVTLNHFATMRLISYIKDAILPEKELPLWR